MHVQSSVCPLALKSFLNVCFICSCAGLEVEGIFRRSASAVTLRKVQGLFNEGEQCNSIVQIFV